MFNFFIISFIQFSLRRFRDLNHDFLTFMIPTPEMLCFVVADGLSILKVEVLFGNTSINPVDKHLKQRFLEFLNKFFVLGFSSLKAKQYLWMAVLLSIVVWVNDSQKHQSVIKQCKILVRYPISFINHDTKYYCRNAGLTNFSWPIFPH